MSKQVVVYFGVLLGDLKELTSDTLTACLNLKNNMLSERSQIQKSIYHVIQFKNYYS